VYFYSKRKKTGKREQNKDTGSKFIFFPHISSSKKSHETRHPIDKTIIHHTDWQKKKTKKLLYYIGGGKR
jgi:hypothetical protein